MAFHIEAITREYIRSGMSARMRRSRRGGALASALRHKEGGPRRAHRAFRISRRRIKSGFRQLVNARGFAL